MESELSKDQQNATSVVSFFVVLASIWLLRRATIRYYVAKTALKGGRPTSATSLYVRTAKGTMSQASVAVIAALIAFIGK